MIVVLTSTLAITANSRAITNIDIQDTVHLIQAKRLGINVGSRHWWGASQILKNLIDNPGFEAGEFGMIFHTLPDATGVRLQEDNWDTSWNNDMYDIGQPEGFWDGAEYEIVYGSAKGRAGTIINFTHEDNRYTYYLDSDGIAPDSMDVVYVRRQLPGFYGDHNEFNQADPNDIRPGSPGSQSLRLLPPDEGWKKSYAYHMDSFWRDGDQTAGKLFLIEGNWHIEIWAKAANSGNTLEISFYREGENTFFNETITLTDEWQHIQRDFYVAPGTEPIGRYPPDAYHPLLGLTLGIPTDGGDVWVDDIELRRADYTNPTAFTDKYVNALKELNPGILRDWGSQLGSTLDNQLAEPWARKTTGRSPHDRIATDYHYSLHEFLQLAQDVGAEPWYVIPPTFSSTEMANLVAYLAAPAGEHPYADKRVSLGQTEPWTEVFFVIHLEYGNEMWGSNDGGDPFIGAALRGGIRLGQVANDRFGSLQSNPHYDAEKFNLIIGGQAGWPPQNELIENNSSNHDTIALAPYFGILDTFVNNEEVFYPLFARPTQDVTTGAMAETQGYLDEAGQGTKLAVYELNFHTTHGPAPLDIRNDFVTGMGGAVALPLYMLTYQHDMGVRNQTAFSSLEYSFRMDNGEYVRLWGMLRDLEATGRKRPTWLGVELANRAIRGDMLVTQHSGDNPTFLQTLINGITEPIEVPYIHSFAFREGDEYAVVLFNLHPTDTQPVTLQTPTTPESVATLHALTSASIHDDNEDDQVVAIQTTTLTDFDVSYELTLAPYSVYVLTWQTTPPVLSYTINYVYRMKDGTSGKGTYFLLDDGTYVDDNGDTGIWRYKQRPARILLKYDAGVACEARSTGFFISPRRVRGPRVCRDGSGVVGSWRGKVRTHQ